MNAAIHPRPAALKRYGPIFGAVVGSLVVAGLSAVIHPLAPLGILVGFWFVFFVLKNPFLLLVLFVAFLLSRPSEFIPALEQFHLGKVFALGTLVLFIVAKLLERDLTFVRAAHNKWLLMLALSVLISSLLGTDRALSIASFLDVFVKILVFFFLALNLTTTPRRAVALQISLAAVSAGLGFYALWSAVVGHNLVEGTRAGLVGLLADPNDLALVLLLSAPFLITMVLDTGGWRRLVALILCAGVLLGILATQSRGGLLGLGAGLFFVFNARIRNKAIVAGVVAVLLAALAVGAGISNRSSGGDMMEQGLDESSRIRLAAWGAGVSMFVRHPVFGVGFECFPQNYLNYAVDPPVWSEYDTHNSYLKVAAETGLTGFIPFMAMVFLSIRGARLLYSVARQRSFPPMVNALLKSNISGLVAVLVAAFFLSHSWRWFIYILHAQIAINTHLFIPSGEERV